MKNYLPKLFLFLLVCWMPTSLLGQYQLSSAYIGYNGMNGSRFYPSKYTLGVRKAQLAGNLDIWAAQTVADFGTFWKAFQIGEFTNAEVDRILRQSKGQNVFGFGMEYVLVGVGLQFKILDHPVHFSLGITERINATLSFSSDALDFAWRGNKPFAGQWKNLGPGALNMTWNREFAIGASTMVFGTKEKIGVRVGGRFKYFMGLLASYTEKGNASIYTDPAGEYVDMRLDYRHQLAGNFDFANFKPGFLFKPAGHGFGFDLGATVYITKNFEVTFSALDLGAMFYRNARSYSNTGTLRFEGLVIGNLLGDRRLDVDTLSYLYKPDVAVSNFTMPLGARFIIQAEYKTPRETKKGLEYNSNTVYLTYIQGVADLPGVTKRPFLSIGYTHNFFKVFSIGLSGAYGGFNRWQAGFHLGFDILDYFQLGLGSDNILGVGGFSGARVGNGVNLFMHGAFAFGKIDKR